MLVYSRYLSRRLFVLLCVLFTGCTVTPYRVEPVHSPNSSPRISSIVLHYTALNNQASLDILTRADSGVSAHYLIPQGCQSSPCPVLRLVEDDQRAWHAGQSQWRGQAGLNASSIGIEIVNLGYPEAEAQLPIEQRKWDEFETRQIETVAALITDLAKRYQIPPQRILGHSDISPGRKLDPGPRFPWRRLHQTYGVGAWPDEFEVARVMRLPAPEDALSWQTALVEYGYALPITGLWDPVTQQVLRAFQLHFRADKVDGLPDLESWARLQVLLTQYSR